MVLEAVACKHCGQTKHIKLHRRTGYGTTRAGVQRYRALTAAEPLRFLWVKQGLAYNFCHIFHPDEPQRKPGELVCSERH